MNKKSLIIPFSISLLLLQGCNSSTEEVKSEDKQEVSQSESTKKIETETTKPKEKGEPEETSNLKDSITVDEFNKLFKQDPEGSQYPNGKYQLKDGSIVYADRLEYVESNIFDYATVIFFEGKIAHIQVDTESSIEDIEKGLGISFEGYTVEPYKFGSGYEVIFNDTFADENIEVFPNEWE